jgi:glyoxylase I family protein
VTVESRKERNVGVKVKGFDHVLVPTDDLARTEEFYKEILGLQEITPEATGYDRFEMSWFEGRGGEIHIVKRDPELTKATGASFNQTMQSHIAFEVEDLEASKAELDRRGYSYYEPRGEGVLARKQLYVEDPSGLIVELYEQRSS